MGEDETKGKGSVDDDGFWMDDDCHLEWDCVEDNDEKNGDENVGAEEQSKQGDGGDAVAEEKIRQWASHSNQKSKHQTIQPECEYVDSVTVSLFAFNFWFDNRKQEPKNSDCETSWLVYLKCSLKYI